MKKIISLKALCLMLVALLALGSLAACSSGGSGSGGSEDDEEQAEATEETEGEAETETETATTGGGVLADFTSVVPTFAEADGGLLASFDYDYDQDGDAETINVTVYAPEGDVQPISVAIYSEPDSGGKRVSPGGNTLDGDAATFVGFVDLDAADGAQDLVVSVANKSGDETTLIFQGLNESIDPDFGHLWYVGSDCILPGSFKSVNDDGTITIGEVTYTPAADFNLTAN